MPTYLGETVSQGFLDMLTTVYKGGYVAMHPAHLPPVESDATLISQMEAASVRGGPDADLLARSPFFVMPASVAYGRLVKADDAVAHWPLGETAGTTAVDVIGGKNGTISGGVTLGQAGALTGGSAMRFDGISGKIVTAAPVALPTSCTLEVWVKTTDTRNNAALLSNRFTVQDGIVGIFTGMSGTILFVDSYQTTNHVLETSGPPVNDGAWHHVVWTMTGTVGTVYLDGVVRVSGTPQPHVPLTERFQMAYDTFHNVYFNGSIDDVAIYPLVLTPTQIKAHYDARIPRTVY